MLIWARPAQQKSSRAVNVDNATLFAISFLIFAVLDVRMAWNDKAGDVYHFGIYYMLNNRTIVLGGFKENADFGQI
jgi:hypothetical protein